MRSLVRLLTLAAAFHALPAHAETSAAVDVAAGRMEEAIRVLGQQTRASIGFRDPALAKLRLRSARGNLTAGQALARMLAGSGARARQVAPDVYVIEMSPAGRKRQGRVQEAAVRPSQPSVSDHVDEDIVVTATKRAVPIADYPGGVQIVDGESLTFADSARGSAAMEMRAASVTSTHLGPGRNKLFVRGIADSSFVGPTQATVGQYWGNSRITYNAPDPSLRLYDVRRIEVLEGPQGTLYGAGSLGGVVRVVPQSPDLYAFGGRLWGGAQAVEHGQPGFDGGTILNVPIEEGRLALRALAFGAYEGGYIDDRLRDKNDVNSVKTIGGRVSLRYEPVDDFSIDLSAIGQRIRGDDSQYADADGDGLTRAGAIAQPYGNDYWLFDLVSRKTWGALELTASFGYSGQQVKEVFEGPQLADLSDLDALPALDAPMVPFAQNNRIRLLTFETRLAYQGAGATGWLIGLSGLHTTGRVTREMDPRSTGAPLTGIRNKVDEVTLYGEGTTALASNLLLTAGARVTWSRLIGEAEDVADAIALRVDPAAGNARSETRLLPSAALAYRPDERWTVFARYQEGFRPGGIAVRRDYIQRFAGDRIQAAEIGARFRARGLETGMTLSYTHWKDIQADVIDGFGFPTTVNIGDGRVLSLGLSGSWRPVPGLSLDAALYLNDSRVLNPALSILPVSTGEIRRRLPNVAAESGRLGFTYSAPVSDDEQLDVSGFARYIGQSRLGIGSVLGRLQGDYLDTGLEVRLGNERRGVSLALTNILDSRGNRFALGSPFLLWERNQITPLQPRSIRLGFEMAF